MGRKKGLGTGWKKLVRPAAHLLDCLCHHLTIDEVELIIQDVRIRVIRRTTLDVPHEVSVFIPRAELRQRQYRNGQLVSEDEKILNSITVVHAPRHPLAGEQPPAEAPLPPWTPGKTPPLPDMPGNPGSESAEDPPSGTGNGAYPKTRMNIYFKDITST